MIRTLCIVFLLNIVYQAQSSGLQEVIGDFTDASCFDINAAGFIFICDSETNEVYKLSPAGITLKTIGGYGWSASAFDNPVDIFATTLNVYVTDQNNHRIQIFDKDLNFLSSFTTSSREDERYKFAYPRSCIVSNQGDLFVLDGDNQRVLKYDLRGNFILEIGNTDAGEFALDDPQDIAVSNSTNLYIADGDIIKVFDVFGSGLARLNSGLSEPKLTIQDNILTISSELKIKYLNLRNQSAGFKNFDPHLDGTLIRKAIVTDYAIYVLIPDKILKYSR